MADKPIREQSALELLETHARALEGRYDRLREFLTLWTYEGNLQTFEDRVRFRTEAQQLLAGVETEPPLPREIWACVSKGISPPYIRFFSSKAEMEAYEWRDTSVSPNCMRVAGPEASGEATGPEGDDSNMGTAPTSGPEATSSQGNAVETAGEQP